MVRPLTPDQPRKPGCPVESSNSHPTERISQFIDFRLQPLVTKLHSYIKNTTHGQPMATFSTNSIISANYQTVFSGGGGVLPYKGLMGTCGQLGYVFRVFCLKQGIEYHFLS